MKAVHLRGERCPDRISCPNVYSTDRGTHLVQGKLSGELDSAAGQAVVEIPLSLIPELAVGKHNDVYLTGRGTVLVRGSRVVDAEALATIILSEGEGAVELAADVCPTLEVTANAH